MIEITDEQEKLIDNNISKSKKTSNNNSKIIEEGEFTKKNEDKEINLEVKNDYYNDLIKKIVPKDRKSSTDVIEDNIKGNEVDSELINKMKKKTDDLDYYELDEDENYRNRNRTKEKFEFHLKINRTFLRYATLIIIIIYILTTIASCIIFHSRRKEYPFLFCFKFIERIPQASQDMHERDIIYFLTDLNSFYIFHITILFIFISICYLMIKGSQSEIEYFFNNMSIFFNLTLILNIPILFMGMFTEYFYGSHLQSIIYLGLTLLSFLCMGKIYLVTKSHKYKTILSYINISVLSSFMAAYQCYCFLFNVCYFIMNFYQPKVDQNNEYPGIEITFSFIYFAVGIVIISIYKDIFFNIAMVNLEIGLLYSKRSSDYLLTTAIVNVGIFSLNYASIITVIFTKNKKVFMLKEKKK